MNEYVKYQLYPWVQVLSIGARIQEENLVKIAEYKTEKAKAEAQRNLEKAKRKR